MPDITSLINYHSGTQSTTVNTDLTMMSDHQQTLVKTAQSLEFGTTSFKHEWFIGEAQFTPYGKLRQWLMELKSRENTVEVLEYDIAKLETEEQILLRDAEEETDELRKKLILIDAVKKHKDIERCKSRVSDVYRERQEIVELTDKLLASDEGKTADGRSLLAVFGTPEEAEYEKQYWTVRLAKQSALDLSAYGRIGAGNLEAILMCSPSQQSEIIGLANHYNITYDKRQDVIRHEVAKRLGTDVGETAYIGQVKASFINGILDADRENVVKDLERQTPKQVNPNGEELNNVYNL
jgi:hypothetical protein